MSLAGNLISRPLKGITMDEHLSGSGSQWTKYLGSIAIVPDPGPTPR
jgi:hypothetical protein